MLVPSKTFGPIEGGCGYVVFFARSPIPQHMPPIPTLPLTMPLALYASHKPSLLADSEPDPPQAVTKDGRRRLAMHPQVRSGITVLHEHRLEIFFWLLWRSK